MESLTAGFVGGGRIVRILVADWQRAGVVVPTICVHEPDASARDALAWACPDVVAHGTMAAVASRDLVILAVHPPAVRKVVAGLRPQLRPEALVLSLAPKITLASMQEALGGFNRVARVIPNAPSLVGRGFNPVYFGPDVKEGARTGLLALLRPLGDTPEVAEDTLEAYAILAAMGPTYLWSQLETLREIGQEVGLSAEAADGALRALVEGALAGLLDSGWVRSYSCHQLESSSSSFPVQSEDLALLARDGFLAMVAAPDIFIEEQQQALAADRARG